MTKVFVVYIDQLFASGWISHLLLLSSYLSRSRMQYVPSYLEPSNMPYPRTIGWDSGNIWVPVRHERFDV